MFKMAYYTNPVYSFKLTLSYNTVYRISVDLQIRSDVKHMIAELILI